METIQKCKGIIYGDSTVGKSSLINRIMFDNFNENQQPSIGADFISKTFQEGQITLRLELWDVAVWSDRFHRLNPYYLKDSKVIIICFDITSNRFYKCEDEASFKNLEQWIDLVKQAKEKDALMYIVGTKTDLDRKRKVTIGEAKQKAFNLNVQYFEVSAKNGENIQEIFKKIIIDLIEKNSNAIKIQEEQKLGRLQQGYEKLNTFVD